MPAVVGAIKIVNVGTGSVVHIGDSIQIAPNSAAKTFAGAGSFNTGDGLRIYNMVSTTNTYDADFADSTITSADKAVV
ncbi:spore germination protein [Paenibacillus mucilaginosus]|uniref:GerPA n=2 Tax=Paenibacillus mucilaginosus TaxID=61624 RepID=H6NBA0_9BACL|nr:spore germination protein [Paenibacillus mucilaginosus]AEI42527.1 GerPA [Paenibacillus mucilaginosus KNP414]AFC32068.1 GerPA [Paenibacillus mucilaginosus 3016]MCG7213920.1 spore germination protein [Paenibacillus mucilaginosus]WDM25925.1 spore germination protein [Paenibacillus mucilaginosus]WFA20577.1 spore germination protein [Paenibacillus mucilaginosus]